MIRTNFELFKGIGPATVAKLYSRGIKDWETALARSKDLPFSAARRERVLREIANATRAVEDGDPTPFASSLQPRDTWQLYSAFAERVVCFDIETTGFSPEFDQLVVITTYRPVVRELKSFVGLRNLDEFLTYLRADDILMGFNCRAFDTPFVKAHFGSRMRDAVQIDLRWVLHGMGVTGPLKKIEANHLGIRRPKSLVGVDGEEAASMCHRWLRKKDERVLDRLLRYAFADTIVLDYIARHTCRAHGCRRFSEPLPAESLFASKKPSKWCQALPDLPAPITSVADAPVPRAYEDPEAEEKARQLRQEHYENLFLMACADGEFAAQERRVLDLFAAKYGLSRVMQKDIEDRVSHSNPASVLIARILSMNAEWKRWYLRELMAFAWVDGKLDPSEEALVKRIVDDIELPESEFAVLRSEAKALGDSLQLHLLR